MDKTTKSVIVVAGGLGYIGSHVILSLVTSGFNNILIIDNLSNTKKDKLSEITKAIEETRRGSSQAKTTPCFFTSTADLRNYDDVVEVFTDVSKESKIVAIINLAGAKSIPESVQNPTLYYDNITISNNLLSCAKLFGIKNYIFSSSSTVYGKDAKVPCVETQEIGRGGFTNPYAFSKFTIEKILEDACKYDDTFSAVSLRYFNPGGHYEIKVGGDNEVEDEIDCGPTKQQEKAFLKDSPVKQQFKNVIPNLQDAALNCEPFKIFGIDFETKDGTAERDYVHITDVAEAHSLVLKKMIFSETWKKGKYEAFNVGLGIPVSVKKLVETFQSVNSDKILMLKVLFEERRPGDLPTYYCDTSKITSQLGWKPKKTLEDILRL